MPGDAGPEPSTGGAKGTAGLQVARWHVPAPSAPTRSSRELHQTARWQSMVGFWNQNVHTSEPLRPSSPNAPAIPTPRESNRQSWATQDAESSFHRQMQSQRAPLSSRTETTGADVSISPEAPSKPNSRVKDATKEVPPRGPRGTVLNSRAAAGGQDRALRTWASATVQEQRGHHWDRTGRTWPKGRPKRAATVRLGQAGRKDLRALSCLARAAGVSHSLPSVPAFPPSGAAGSRPPPLMCNPRLPEQLVQLHPNSRPHIYPAGTHTL